MFPASGDENTMTAAEYAVLINLASAGAVLLMTLPVLLHLFTGWRIRRDKLLAYLSDDALEVYYSQFPWKAATEPDLTKTFRRQFHYLYGRRHFVLPLALFVGVTIFSGLGVSRSVKAWFKVADSPYALPGIAVSALLGAFAWVITDQLGRMRRRDLAPIDVYGWVFRLLVAVPFGFAFAAVLKDQAGIPIAFFLGAFPTQTLFTFARRIAAQRLNAGDGPTDAVLELTKLQSIDRVNAERFEDEGINTIATLAWSDPIDLTIRTNFDFNYVLDCMSQALLWVYVEEKGKLLYPLSLRGAQEVNTLWNKLGGVTIPIQDMAALNHEQKAAAATLQSAATVLNVDEVALCRMVQEVALDPYTRFIVNVWH